MAKRKAPKGNHSVELRQGWPPFPPDDAPREAWDAWHKQVADELPLADGLQIHHARGEAHAIMEAINRFCIAVRKRSIDKIRAMLAELDQLTNDNSRDSDNIKGCMEAGTHPARPFAPVGFPVYHNAHQATVRMAWDILNAADWADRALADVQGAKGYRRHRYSAWSERSDASIKAAIELLASMRAPNFRQWRQALDAEMRDALSGNPGLAARIEHEEWATSGQSVSDDLWGQWDDETRDAWIYQQCCDHRPHRDVIAFIDQHPTWLKITSPAGVVAAALRYAKANNLPPPPRRYKKRAR